MQRMLVELTAYCLFILDVVGMLKNKDILLGSYSIVWATN